MKIRWVEVGPRDGLQNESVMIPTQAKIAFINALSLSGVDEIEVSAFVSPEWVPQLADAEEVFKGISRNKGVVYSALVPNERGLERAMLMGVEKIAVFTAASDTFARKNVNTDIAGTLKRFAPVVASAKKAGMLVRGYVSTSFWCPYEGFVQPSRVCEVAQELLHVGVDELSMGDTIGKATASEVVDLLQELLLHVPADRLAMHFHDTYGRALGNVAVAFDHGITAFDASVGGLGGCPYAPGAPGNVSTELAVECLRAKGAQCEVDLTALQRARQWVAPYVAKWK
jgi:hydroxymethylglutaryl-CoA lyase